MRANRTRGAISQRSVELTRSQFWKRPKDNASGIEIIALRIYAVYTRMLSERIPIFFAVHSSLISPEMGARFVRKGSQCRKQLMPNQSLISISFGKTKNIQETIITFTQIIIIIIYLLHRRVQSDLGLANYQSSTKSLK